MIIACLICSFLVLCDDRCITHNQMVGQTPEIFDQRENSTDECADAGMHEICPAKIRSIFAL